MTITFNVHNFVPGSGMAADVDTLMVMIRNATTHASKKTFFYVGEAHDSELDILRRRTVHQRILAEAPSVTMVIERGMDLARRAHDIVEEPSQLSSFDDTRNVLVAKDIARGVKSKTAVVVFLFGADHDLRLRDALLKRSRSDDDDETCNWVSVAPLAKKPDAKLLEMKSSAATVARAPDAYTFPAGASGAENLLKLSQQMTVPVFSMRLYSSEVIKSIVSPREAVYEVYINEAGKRKTVLKDIVKGGGDAAVDVSATGAQDFLLIRTSYAKLPSE